MNKWVFVLSWRGVEQQQRCVIWNVSDHDGWSLEDNFEKRVLKYEFEELLNFLHINLALITKKGKIETRKY